MDVMTSQYCKRLQAVRKNIRFKIATAENPSVRSVPSVAKQPVNGLSLNPIGSDTINAVPTRATATFCSPGRQTMSFLIRMFAAITLLASIAFCPAEAQQSPDADMLREMREQIEILSERINRSPERDRIRELEEHIEMLERERRQHPPGSDPGVDASPRGPKPGPKPGPRHRPPRFRAPDRLEQSVTLEFKRGGAVASITTAQPMYRVEGHNTQEAHQNGETMKHEETAFHAAGMVELNEHMGTIFVSCEGTFVSSYNSTNGKEEGKHEETNLEFNASIRLRSGEEKKLVSQGGSTLTIKATLQPLTPPRKGPPAPRK